jgi:hypothetical protein
MSELDRNTATQQKAGGFAALYLAAAFLIAMPYFLVVVNSVGVTDPAQKVALLAANRGSMYAMHLISYVIFGIVLAVLALALHSRLRDESPVTMQVATAVGLIWAFVLVASGMVYNYGMWTVTTLYGTDRVAAVSAWQAIEPIAQGLGGASGELLGGLWVLLVSAVVLRYGALPKALGWLGLGVGVLGIASVVPILNDAAIAFGLLEIVWFAWVGVVLVRGARASVSTQRTASSAALQRGAVV